MTAAITAAVGLLGVALGAVLARRAAKRSETERLLAEAINDLVAAIADVANVGSIEAQARYASATSRVGLHGSPVVVAAFRRFQELGTTGTSPGRARLVEAVQAARSELGRGPADTDDLSFLLFGHDRLGPGA